MSRFDEHLIRYYMENFGYTRTQAEHALSYSKYKSNKDMSWLPVVGGYYENRSNQMEDEENVRREKDRERNLGYSLWDSPYPIYSVRSHGVEGNSRTTPEFAVNSAIMALYNGRYKFKRYFEDDED